MGGWLCYELNHNFSDYSMIGCAELDHRYVSCLVCDLGSEPCDHPGQPLESRIGESTPRS
eukprot:14162646-Heterocapsa_arctica.AAC.1